MLGADSTVDLLRAMIAAVARPRADPAAIAALLVNAGYQNAGECVTVQPGDRRGACFPVLDGAEIDLERLQEMYGPGRRQLALDSDGPTGWTWDIAAAGSEHVVLTAELDDSEVSVLRLMLTPYSL